MSNVLILVRGLPGSGKSTLSKTLLGEDNEHLILEADKFMVNKNTGIYSFNPMLLGACHKLCQEATEEQMYFKNHLIVVSNTFTTEKEMEPYYKLAEKYDYQVFSIIVENRHGRSEETNIHKVPVETIVKMRQRFQICL